MRKKCEGTDKRGGRGGVLLDPSHYPLSTYISLSIFSLVGNGGQDLPYCPLFPSRSLLSNPWEALSGSPSGKPPCENCRPLVDIERSRFTEEGKENDRYGARDRETEKGERSNYPLQAVFRVTPKTGVGVSSPLATRKPPLLETNKRQEPLLLKKPCQKKQGYCDSPSFVF